MMPLFLAPAGDPHMSGDNRVEFLADRLNGLRGEPALLVVATHEKGPGDVVVTGPLPGPALRTGRGVPWLP